MLQPLGTLRFRKKCTMQKSEDLKISCKCNFKLPDKFLKLYFFVTGEEELLVGAILVHMMEVATMNSHEIGHLQVSKS